MGALSNLNEKMKESSFSTKLGEDGANEQVQRSRALRTNLCIFSGVNVAWP